MSSILSTDTVDQQCYENLNQQFVALIATRTARSTAAINAFMSVNGFTQDPKPSLQAITRIRDKMVVDGSDSSTMQAIIDSGEYAQTPEELQYKADYNAMMATFVWPDANEIALRAQEEADLVAQL